MALRSFRGSSRAGRPAVVAEGSWTRSHPAKPRVPMRKPMSVRSLEQFGRVRLSSSFFLRDFLHSEIADLHGIPNIPDDPDLAIAAGRRLCEELLEPLQATFGRLAIRSAYRAPAINAFGNAHGLSCASNERNYARHIWDRRDVHGCMGALATVVVPWFADGMLMVPTGGQWPGGSITTFRIASCSSSRSLQPSKSDGMSAQSVGSTALFLRVVV